MCLGGGKRTSLRHLRHSTNGLGACVSEPWACNLLVCWEETKGSQTDSDLGLYSNVDCLSVCLFYFTYLSACLTYLLSPKRRVRDVGGPSPAAARVERCVNVTNPLMARPDDSSASATARRHGYQLPLLLKLFHSQSCGHKQLDMLSLLLGRSRPDGQLVKVFSALLVRIVRDDTSQFVVAPANRTIRMLVSLGMLQW